MPGDAEATKKRLIEAGAREFAEYGIAGARVDRIADLAKSNKAQIYHYFGSKDALFDAVFHELVVGTVREVPIDAGDLPEYAARLFDGYQERPEVLRIATWYRLERAGTQSPLRAIVASNQHKVDSIEAAQRAGTIPSRWPAADLLMLVLAMSTMWNTLTPEFADLVAARTHDERRTLVANAVKALLAPDEIPDSR
ncbi:TetR family transcriptional regulator [Pseudonocardia spinosispora]|uniref:TetR family transcriptional regulator n=1 Tax=Pseudonocardia spinosispora TaxID=103441 RepID=UPI000406E726|nr:TetR family transcriptional regulator [Pseudonocardia spinosispora]